MPTNKQSARSFHPARRAGKFYGSGFVCVGSSPRSEMADPQQAVVFRSKVRAGARVSFERAMVCLRADVVGEQLMGMSYANKLERRVSFAADCAVCFGAWVQLRRECVTACAAARLALRVGESTPRAQPLAADQLPQQITRDGEVGAARGRLSI